MTVPRLHGQHGQHGLAIPMEKRLFLYGRKHRVRPCHRVTALTYTASVGVTGIDSRIKLETPQASHVGQSNGGYKKGLGPFSLKKKKGTGCRASSFFCVSRLQNPFSSIYEKNSLQKHQNQNGNCNCK